MKRMKTRVCLLFILIAGTSWCQLPNGRNHPELYWRTWETPHFKVIFHQELDSLAALASRIAEELYDPIITDLDVRPKGKIPLILTDVDDISNGIANPLDHTIFIWTQNDKKEATGSLHWLRRVIGHELAHMVNFWGFRNILGKPWELLTLGLTPTWFLEGVAQYEAESWDDHRDLLLRSAVRDSALLPPRKLDGYVGADIIDSRLVYEEGHGLVRHIAHQYGREKIRDLIQNHRKFPLSFTWTMKRTLGKTTGSLFQEWKDDVHRTYRHVFREKEIGEHIGTSVPIPLQTVTGVRWSQDGTCLAAVGMERWDEGIQWLYIKNTDEPRWHHLGSSHVGSYFSWAPDGNRLVISRKRRGKHGSLVHDLYIVDVERDKETRITRDARATDPAWSPVREEICFVKRYTGGSTLGLLDLESGQRRPVLLEAAMDVFSPSWSPDGEYMAFSFIDKEGRRDIGLVRRDGGAFRRLTDDVVDDRTPAWSPDGEWIAFARYENGTSNLFRMRKDGSEIRQMTDAAGAVFNPAWTPDGTGIAAVFFEKRDSIGVVIIPSQRSVHPTSPLSRPAWTDVEPHREEAKSGYNPDTLVLRPRPYRSFCYVRPLIALPWAGRDDGGYQVGLIHYSADPLYKHQVLGTLTARRRVDWTLNYTNAQLHPLIDISLWGRTYDRGEYLVEEGPRLWERREGGQLRLSLPMNFGRTLLSNHVIYFAVNAERVRVLSSDSFDVFQPHFHPFSGWINSIILGYTWFWERPDVGYDIHPSTGCSFSASLLRSHRFLKSDIDRTRLAATLTVRQELPWKRHVLGVRMGTLFQWGDQPIQDPLDLRSPIGMRGLSYSREGDRFLYGTAEYRIPLTRDFGLRIPIFYFERFAWAFWSDWGKAWGRHLMTYETGVRQRFGQTDWVVSAGGELRCRIYLWGKLPVVISAGYGRELLDGNGGGWYWLIGSVF